MEKGGGGARGWGLGCRGSGGGGVDRISKEEYK